MHLMYVDESGGTTSVTADQNHFVLGAVSVYEKRPYFLTQELDELCAQLIPGSPAIELHGSPMFNGNGAPWASMKRDERRALMNKVYKYIASQNVTLFAVVVQKSSLPTSSDPLQRACEELAGHFDAYLQQLSIEWNDKQLGLMVFDESKHAKTVHALLQEFRTTGAKFGRIKHLAEAPMFAESKLTRALQIADFVAYAVFRRYERGDSYFFDQIVQKFYQADGRMHGLVHLNGNDKNCFCPACVTRRQA